MTKISCKKVIQEGEPQQKLDKVGGSCPDHGELI